MLFPTYLASLGSFSCVPRADESHAVSSEVRIQIRCLVKLFAAHLTGQRALLFHALGGGRRWCRTVQGALVIVVLAVAGGACRVCTEGLLVVGECVSHFVDDEAMARQGGDGCEAGAAL